VLFWRRFLHRMTDRTPLKIRRGQLVRLRGFDQTPSGSKNDQLARVISNAEACACSTGKCQVKVVVGRPPVPVTSARLLMVLPHHLQHVCEYCFVATPALQMCGKCKTVLYCNAKCQRADWARHKVKDCGEFDPAHVRGMPLPIECLRGDLKEMRRLVEVEGADVNKAAEGNPSPVVMAAQEGHVKAVRYLVEHGADKDKADELGRTPLIIAADNDHLAVVQYLVEQGADKDRTDIHSATPLWYAAQGGHLAVAKYLVEQGADKNLAKRLDGVFRSVCTTTPTLVEYQVRPGDGMFVSPLNVARARGHRELAAYLLAAGCT